MNSNGVTAAAALDLWRCEGCTVVSVLYRCNRRKLLWMRGARGEYPCSACPSDILEMAAVGPGRSVRLWKASGRRKVGRVTIAHLCVPLIQVLP